VRGAGTRGLAGVYPTLEFERGRVVRPLLGISRAEVESYLESVGQSWREDASNLDRRFTRNRVRYDLLPVLERDFNPNIRDVLSGLAEVSRAEEEYWQDLVERELRQRIAGLKLTRVPAEAGSEPREVRLGRGPEGPLYPDLPKSGVLPQTRNPASTAAAPVPRPTTDDARLDLAGLAALPLALQRRLLRRFAGVAGLTLDFEHVENLLHCATGYLARTELPGGWVAERSPDPQTLTLRRTPPERDAVTYEYRLPVPGEVGIPELGFVLRALEVAPEFAPELPNGDLLSGDLIGPELIVRNWRPGDRFWPVGRGSEEKLKRLFADQHIPASQRPCWPVALKGSQVVWVRGFPVARAFGWKGSGPALKIEVLAGVVP